MSSKQQKFKSIVQYFSEEKSDFYDLLESAELLYLFDENRLSFIFPNNKLLKKIKDNLESSNNEKKLKGINIIKSLIIEDYYEDIFSIKGSFKNSLDVPISVKLEKEEDSDSESESELNKKKDQDEKKDVNYLLVRINGSKIYDSDIIFSNKKEIKHKLFFLKSGEIPLSNSTKEKKSIQKESDDFEINDDEEKQKNIKNKKKMEPIYDFNKKLYQIIHFNSPKTSDEISLRCGNFIIFIYTELKKISNDDSIAKDLLTKLLSLLDYNPFITFVLFFEPFIELYSKDKRVIGTESERKIIFDIIESVDDLKDVIKTRKAKYSKIEYNKLFLENPIEKDRNKNIRTVINKKIFNIRNKYYDSTQLPIYLKKSYDELIKNNTIDELRNVYPECMFMVYRHFPYLKLLQDEFRFKYNLIFINMIEDEKKISTDTLVRYIKDISYESLNMFESDDLTKIELFSKLGLWLMSDLFLYVPTTFDIEEETYVTVFNPTIKNQIFSFNKKFNE